MQTSRSLPSCTASAGGTPRVRTPPVSHSRQHSPLSSPPPPPPPLPTPPLPTTPTTTTILPPLLPSLQRQRTSLLSGPPEGRQARCPSDSTMDDWPSESCSWVPAAAVRTMAAAARVARVGGIGSDTYLVEMRHTTCESDQDFPTSNQSENVHMGGGGGGGAAGGAGDGGAGDGGRGDGGEGSVGSMEGNALSGVMGAGAAVEARVIAGAHGDSSTPRQRRSQRARYPKSFVRVWPPEERSLRCPDSADDDTLLDAWSDALALEEPPSAMTPRSPQHHRGSPPHSQRSPRLRPTMTPTAPAFPASTATQRNIGARAFTSLCSLWENPALHCSTVRGVRGGDGPGGGGSGSTTASASECTGMEGGEVPAPPLQQWMRTTKRTLRDASEALAVLGAAFSYEAQRLMGGVTARLERGASAVAAAMTAQAAAEAAAEAETAQATHEAQAQQYAQLREDLLRKELRQLRVVLESQQKVLQAKDELLSSLGKMAATERHITCGMMRLHIGTDEQRLERWARNGRRVRLLRRALGALRAAAREGRCRRRRREMLMDRTPLEGGPALEEVTREQEESPAQSQCTAGSTYSMCTRATSETSWQATPAPGDEGPPFFQSDEGSAAQGMLLAATWAAAALVAAAANTNPEDLALQQQQGQMQQQQQTERSPMSMGFSSPRTLGTPASATAAPSEDIHTKPTPTPTTHAFRDDPSTAMGAGPAEDLAGSPSEVIPEVERRDAWIASGVRSGLKTLNFQPLRVIHLAKDGNSPPYVTCYPSTDPRTGNPTQPPPSPATHPLLLSTATGPNYQSARGRRRKDTWMAHVLVPVRRVSLPRNSTVAQTAAAALRRPKRPSTRPPSGHALSSLPQQQQHASSYFPTAPSRQH